MFATEGVSLGTMPYCCTDVSGTVMNVCVKLELVVSGRKIAL
jgi:hypothetical protein